MSPVAGFIIPRLPHLPDSQALPRGLELSQLYAAFLRAMAGIKSQSCLANHSRTRDLTRGLPEYPSPGDVAVWLQALRASGMAHSTCGLHRDNLGAVYSWGNKAAVVCGNPALLCPWTHAKPRPKALPNVGATWAKVLRSSRAWGWSDRELAFCAVLRFEGLRLGECLGLEPQHVRLEAHELEVRQQRALGGWEVSAPKTAHAKRVLPLRVPVRPFLRRVVGLGPAQVRRGLGGGELEQSPFLFPLSKERLAQLLAQLGEVAPLFRDSGNAWHVWRHSFACELHRAGRSADVISGWLGHASVATTQVYLGSLMGERVAHATLKGLD